MKKILFGRVTSLVIIISIIFSCNAFVFAQDKPFSYEDVKDYYPYSSWAVDVGKKYNLIFLENNNREVKRWEIVNILYDILDLKEVQKPPKEFVDIAEVDNTLKKRIYSVANMGFVTGYWDDTFRPFNNVTRAEFVAMVYRTGILDIKSVASSPDKFEDIQNHWAREFINKVSQFGIISGKGDNKFCPEDYITSQEILVILDRLERINCISFDSVISSMTDTFKCKKYSEEERYIIDVMYSQFDNVQNDINYKWPYKEYYNPENWQELATYEDLITALYFTVYKENTWYDKGEEGREKIDILTKNIMYVQGIDVDTDIDKYLSKNFNVRNLLKAVKISEEKDNRILTINRTDIKFGSEEYIKMVNFSNIKEMSLQDQMLLSSSCINYKHLKALFDDSDMYFSLDVPITKYILNYVILRLQENYYFVFNTAGYMFNEFLGSKDYDIETNTENLPYNYYEYPYVIKGVPKEVYEKPFIYAEQGRINTPKDCFNHYSRYALNLLETSYHYYDTIFNVDYRTINIEDFVDKMYKYGVYAFEADARKYAQYVIDNKIVLKGKGCAIPGTIFISDITAYVRVMLEFEIVSANEKKNLLFGDFRVSTPVDIDPDVIYGSDKYSLCIDVPVSGSYNFNKENLEFGWYKIMYSCIADSVYPHYESNILY